MVAHNIDFQTSAYAQPDIAVRAANGELVAVVEIKAGAALSLDIARQLRSNLASHDLLPHSAYFLLTTQDGGFLWLPHPQPWLDALPNLEFSMKPVIARYLHGADAERWLWEGELVLIVADWLSDLNLGLGDPQLEPERSLAASGFLDLMRSADVVDATA